jgi:hypothetical protein
VKLDTGRVGTTTFCNFLCSRHGGVSRFPGVALQDTIAALDAFVPSHEEHEDVARFYSLTDQPEGVEQIRAATPALLRIFERFPHALLGSPGPVVHCIEKAETEAFLPMLLQSFVAHPTRMTLWMLQRCLRSSPSPQSRRAMIEALRNVRVASEGLDVRDDIDETIEEHGSPSE